MYKLDRTFTVEIGKYISFEELEASFNLYIKKEDKCTKFIAQSFAYLNNLALKDNVYKRVIKYIGKCNKYHITYHRYGIQNIQGIDYITKGPGYLKEAIIILTENEKVSKKEIQRLEIDINRTEVDSLENNTPHFINEVLRMYKSNFLYSNGISSIKKYKMTISSGHCVVPIKPLPDEEI